MGSEEFSLIIWCWHDEQTGNIQLRMVHVDTGEEIPIKDGSFLLRIANHTDSSMVRCYIRHMASGREAYLQGGSKLRLFIKDCLLNRESRGPGASRIPGT
jgi:hypothetical protein